MLPRAAGQKVNKISEKLPTHLPKSIPNYKSHRKENVNISIQPIELIETGSSGSGRDIITAKGCR